MTEEDVSLKDHVEALIEAQEKFLVAMIHAAEASSKQRMDLAGEAVIQALQAAKEAVAAALAAAKEAVLKAEVSADDKFKLLNELRGAMKDQAALMATRVEVEALIKAGAIITSSNASRLDKLEGITTGADSSWSTVVGGGGFIVGILGLLAVLYATFHHT